MVSISILNTHSEKNLKEFIKEANKNIRAQISAEVKEERKKFSKEMSEKRKIEKEKRIIKIPKKAKKEDLIKVIMDNKKHFKDIKEKVKNIKIKKESKQTQDNEIKKLDNEIKDLTPKIKDMSSSQLVSLSKKYMNFKELVGLDNKKHKGIVKAILKRQEELKKPQVPKITITEAEEPKGGGAAYPKSKLPPIPKPTAKIRIVPKKPKAQLGQSGIGKKRKRVEGPPKKKKIIDVSVKREKPKAKPKIPTITITEEDKPKKKVIKVGGRFITPKPKAEPKSTLPPIPKPTAKIRLPKYNFNFMKKIKFSNDSSKNDRLAENAIRKNFNKKDIIKMCDVLYKNKNSKEFFKMTKNLEGESYEELVESNILEICEEYDFEEKAKPKGKAKAKDSEELQELSKFKKKSGDKETTDSFISAIEKRQKEDEAKMDELKKERAKETQRLIKALEAQRAQQAETESEDEPDEIPYKDFKLIEGVPKNIKRIFYDYVDDRTGYANAENQKGEIEELQRIEKNYIQAEATRKNKSESAKNQ
jgi:hypothetical protein